MPAPDALDPSAYDEASPVAAVEAALERAASVGEALRAFIVVDADGARRAARRAEAAAREGRSLGPLHGEVVTLKDLIVTKGLPTTAGSRALGDGLPGDRDAPLVRHLRRAGAIVLGKTNLNEFAYGVTGENAHFGQTLNPWDRTRMSGGSSGGSAAALAVGIGMGSVGTDTRGSIRIPASCCGVTGFKPSRGRVPTEGVFPLSWSLDHAGPLARSVVDAARLLGVMVGGRGGPARFTGAAERGVEGLRLGVCPFFFRGLDGEVEASVRDAVDVLADLGMDVREIEIPELEGSLRASAAIAASEALAVHEERVRERRGDYGPAMLARLEKGYALSALELVRAERAREALSAAYRRAFRDVDCMAGPTLPGLPAPVGSATMQTAGGGEEGVVDASCRLNAPQNMTGAPALSVPCGFSRSGLPIGLQLWAARGADDVVLAVGGAWQRATAWHLQRPPEVGEGA
ncbi:MAG: amidase [Gemmatimonadetes bacterium]|nr:amidase [Gemmatimonadota bacterium]